MTAKEKCELCEKDSEYAWRVGELEKKVGRLYNLLITTAISSFGTLAGVIVLLITK